jgi:prepilin-type N-terminal cleavage/methylation domain-containing protein
MKMRSNNPQHGFTLLELMIASLIGVIVMAAMTSMFRVGMNATFAVTQRAETQQNMRAAIEIMSKDISMAGAGLPSGGLQLPAASAIKVACNQTGSCYVPGDVYPNGNYMSGVLPGFSNGVQNGAVITSAPAAVNDSITTIYCDYNFPLSNFTFSFPDTVSANVTVKNAGVLPNNIQAPGGLNVGDLILFTVSSPGPGNGNQGTAAGETAAVGEITGLPAPVGGPQGTITVNFAAADPLNFNQNAATANSFAALAAAAPPANSTTTACRLNAVTYFLQVPPAGGTVQTPRLMRQVNGLTAVPVADNIINLQFSYDVVSTTGGTIDANQANPIAAGDSIPQIQKVNMWVMGQGLTSGNNRSQSMYLASSVSTRNMSFCNSYSYLATACN